MTPEEWAQISQAVDLQNLMAEVQKGGDLSGALTSRIQVIKERLHGETVEAIQAQVATKWKGLQDQGYPLPPLSTVTDHAMDAAEWASPYVKGAWGQVAG